MNKNKWVYNKPSFESDIYNKEMMKYSPWSGHRNFVYDFMAYKKPGVVVELGSYYGCSAFTFLQAVKDMELETKFYAVDTWKGDIYTKDDYREDVYNEFISIYEKSSYKQTGLYH